MSFQTKVFFEQEKCLESDELLGSTELLGIAFILKRRNTFYYHLSCWHDSRNSDGESGSLSIFRGTAFWTVLYNRGWRFDIPLHLNLCFEYWTFCIALQLNVGWYSTTPYYAMQKHSTTPYYGGTPKGY